jgi:hypothetical protein
MVEFSERALESRVRFLEEQNRGLKARMEHYETELGRISCVYSNVLQMLATTKK